MYITATFTHLVAKLYKNKNLRCSFNGWCCSKATTVSVACQSY